jgi:glycosyltransferase involved in cell wall biosynthesis
MRILLITQEPPLKPKQVATGNSVRTAQLVDALAAADHEIEQAWLSKESGISGRSSPQASFRNHDELHSILMKTGPDAILVSYWELLGLLPHDLDIPVILDFVAPRPLEELYDGAESVQFNMRRLHINLDRCDLVLVGNERQSHLMIYTLIDAGFDLRENLPLLVIPPGAAVVNSCRTDPGGAGWRLVTGGVNWPWRNDTAYSHELDSISADESFPVQVTSFGGTYRHHQEEPQASSTSEEGNLFLSGTEHRDLAPYEEYSQYLSNSAHIGVELAEWNIERAYSQSYRSLEFLRHGLPVLCNDYLSIARLVRKYDAGWIVSEPGQLAEIMGGIVTDPAAWKQKSLNAHKLVESEFEPGQSVRPLIEWLKSPSVRPRIQRQPLADDVEPVLGVPPLKTRLVNQFKLVRKVIYGKWCGKPVDPALIIVTRGDLFPADHGAAVRTIATARGLAAQGMSVAIVTDDRRKWYRVTGESVTEEKYPLWTRLLALPGALTKLLHFSKDMPFSDSFLYLPLTDGSFYWRTVAVMARTGARLLQAEFPAYSKPCIEIRKRIKCRVILVEHNVEYDRLKNQVPELLDRQYENLKSIEIKLCNESDAVVCVSENDRQKLAEDGVAAHRLHTIPHGVDLSQYDLPAVGDIRQKFSISQHDPILVFHGTFSYPPNLNALKTLAEIVLPGLEERGVRAHVLAIGRSPPAVSPHQRIHLTGSVSEIGPWLKAGDLAVVPLTDGGGTRMKIMDCFAAGLPVITTSKGIEGIPAVPGQHALILDDWDGFIDGIISLLGNADQHRAMAQEGRTLAESMDWETIAQKYMTIYGGL